MMTPSILEFVESRLRKNRLAAPNDLARQQRRWSCQADQATDPDIGINDDRGFRRAHALSAFVGQQFRQNFWSQPSERRGIGGFVHGANQAISIELAHGLVTPTRRECLSTPTGERCARSRNSPNRVLASLAVKVCMGRSLREDWIA